MSNIILNAKNQFTNFRKHRKIAHSFRKGTLHVKTWLPRIILVPINLINIRDIIVSLRTQNAANAEKKWKKKKFFYLTDIYSLPQKQS